MKENFKDCYVLIIAEDFFWEEIIYTLQQDCKHTWISLRFFYNKA